MRIFIYALQSAIKNLWIARWINILTVLSISVGLLLLSAFLIITLNVDSLINRWSTGFGMVVYLQDTITSEDEKKLTQLLQGDSEILEIKFISNEEALNSLRQVLGSQASILQELDENPLPSSFELTIRQDMISPALVEKKAARLRALEGVDDVQYGEEWLSSLSTISRLLNTVALLLGGAIFIAISFITYTTIKILFYRRLTEIETMKLLGATRTFIKLPFLMEGLCIGFLSGSVSAVLLFGLHHFTAYKLIEFLPSMRALVIELPLEGYLSIPVAGALLSLIGSFFATGRVRY